MDFEKYIDDIIQLIEVNIDRLNKMELLGDVAYHISSKNYFDLTWEEYQKLKSISDEIYVENELGKKFPRNFIFDKLVNEVIIESYDLTSTTEDIRLNLKQRLQCFIEILNEEIKEYTYFIPVSGIFVEEKIIFNSISIYPFNDFKNEIKIYFKGNEDKFNKIELNYLFKEINELNMFCFVKLTVNGTYETSKDIALNKVNELLSIFSLYKPHNINGFGIVGDVLPLDSHSIFYLFQGSKLKTSMSTSVRNRSFNLTKALEHMKENYLEYLIDLLNKNEFNYVEKILFNALGWYYQSVKSEFIMKSDVAEVTLNSKNYYEHYNYYKLGVKLINLISSVESIILFNKRKPSKIRKSRFNKIMNYSCENFTDYYVYLDELYDLRNDIVHNNDDCNLLKFNVEKYTELVNMFIIMFVEIKYDFDMSEDNFLDSKKDLEKFFY